MTSLQDYWNEQILNLLVEPTYETRLRLTNTVYIDPHTPNKLFIPLDEQARYKQDKRRYYDKCSHRHRKSKTLIKNRKEKSRLNPKQSPKIVQPEILTDTDVSSGPDETPNRNNKRIYVNHRELQKTSQNNSHTDFILSKKERNLLSRTKGIRHDSKLFKE